MPVTRVQQKTEDNQPKFLRFSVQGTPYFVEWSAMSFSHQRQLYLKAGVTPISALDALRQNGLWGLAPLIFLARLQAGETNVDYEAIEDALFKAASSEDGLDISFTEEDGTDPPEPGANS